MADKVEVASLAKLVRLDVPAAELAKLETELPAIIAFVESIQAVDTSGVTQDTSLRNVMRADENPHESGLYTEDLLTGAPTRDGNRFAVKQVLTRKDKK